MTSPGNTVEPEPKLGPMPRAVRVARARPRRRRVWRFAAVAVLLCVGLIGAFVGRLFWGPMVLPDLVEARVEAALDDAMAMNRLSLGEIALSAEQGTGLDVVMRDITLTDLDGDIRAAFPALQVSFAPDALLRGRLRPTRIEVADAGLRLSRDADGQLDLQLTQGGAALSLEETMERIDRMFEAADFVDLQSVSGTGLNVAMADRMTGQVMRVREADMLLERKNGAVTLVVSGGLEGTRDARLDLAITRNAPLSRTVIGMTFSNLSARDLATASPAMAWLDLMRAPISGRLVARLQDDGAIGALSGQLDIGAGQLSITGAEAPLRFDGIEAAFSYNPDTTRLAFDRIQVAAPELSFSAEGHADVAPDGTVFVGQFRLSEVEADPRELFEAPLALERAAIDLRLTLGPTLLVEIGQAVLVDGAQQARARATIREEAEGLSVSVDAQIAEIGIDNALAYWPVGAIVNTRRWLSENVQDARLRGVDFALRQQPGHPAEIALDFDYDGATVRAVRTMPPISDASGYLSLTGPRLVMRMDAGRIDVPGGGALAMSGSHLVLPTTRVRGPEAQISLALAGDMQDVLRLAQEPPLNLFAEGAMTAERLGSGHADLSVRIETRFARNVPLSEIDYAVEGVIRDYRSDALVPGRRLEAEALQVSVLPDAVSVAGRARLDGVPLTGTWSRALGPAADPTSRVVARATLDADALATFGVRLPDGMLSGQGQAQIALDLVPGEVPVMTVTSDLQGVGLAVPQLGWRLGQGRTGDLQATVRLGPNPAVTDLRVEGAGLRLAGRVDLEAGAFQRLVADHLRIGNWLDVTGVLRSRGRGVAPAIAVTGGVLDLRGLPQGGGGGGGGGGSPISVALDRLQVTNTIALTALSGELASAGGLSGQFAGRVNGDAPVTGTLSTSDAGPAVRLRAEDGGAVLRSAGLIRNIHGGALELIIAAIGAVGTYDGQLTIDNPRLRDAPAMAELLNLISVVGLLDQLSAEGINLGDVYARFVITPSQIRVTRGDAVGPSLGLSMDGAYDVTRRQFDMQGVISPLYMVNGFFGALFAPRREGLFGFTYRLTGTPEQTNVSVNPLSILTPGIFREIFRRPPPAPVETE